MKKKLRATEVKEQLERLKAKLARRAPMITPLENCRLEGEKRQHLPFSVSAVCPQCDAIISLDLTEHYLSYPDWGEKYELSFEHETEDKTHSWKVTVIPGLNLTLA